MLVSISLLVLVIWVVLFFVWGNFWRIWEFDSDPAQFPAPAVWPRVAAVIPARNEAASIKAAVQTLALQEYAGDFSIVVVDDHSDDGTAEIAGRAAQQAGAAVRVCVVSAPELASGWTGKLSALNAGVANFCSADISAPSREFREMNPVCAPIITLPGTTPPTPITNPPEFFWFSDADVVHAPDTLRRLVSRAEADSLDLASLMVLLRAETFAERLLIPPFLYFFLMLYPPRWIANRGAKTAGAAGGCILLRRTALERIGGIAAIRGEVIDDCALARAVKQSGGKIWMGLTRASRSLRSYETFFDIRDMIARTAFTQLQYSVLQLVGTLLGMATTFLLPIALTFSTDVRAWPFALAAWCLMTASFLPTVAFYRLRPIWGLLLPLVALFYTYATCLSAVRYWSGRGGQWKGRAQAKQKTPS
jgi:glycosyl transferase family 2